MIFWTSNNLGICWWINCYSWSLLYRNIIDHLKVLLKPSLPNNGLTNVQYQTSLNLTFAAQLKLLVHFLSYFFTFKTTLGNCECYPSRFNSLWFDCYSDFNFSNQKYWTNWKFPFSVWSKESLSREGSIRLTVK